MRVYSTFDVPVAVEEVNSGELITEVAGYIPAQVQIEDMIMAGARLDASRAERFDFASEEEVDESFEDITRSSNFDMADAAQIRNELVAKAEVSEKNRKENEKKSEVRSVDELHVEDKKNVS